MADLDEVERVFEEWRSRQASPGRVTLSEERRRLIASRLNRASADDLVMLVRYAFEAETSEARFWRGEDGGRAYLGLDNLLRISKLDDRIDRARSWAEEQGDEDDDGDDDGIVFGVLGALRRSS
jgi:hypothetical protein